jgi:hypothetical protein
VFSSSLIILLVFNVRAVRFNPMYKSAAADEAVDKPTAEDLD